MISVLSLCLIAALAGFGGMIHWQPSAGAFPRILLVFVVPGFTEELVFRGLLIPSQGETKGPGLWITLGVSAFVVWHVVEALTFLPGAHLFTTPLFLFCAGILGLACALMRYRTGSLWPAIVLHGLTVCVWQACMGGPAMTQLLKG